MFMLNQQKPLHDVKKYCKSEGENAAVKGEDSFPLCELLNLKGRMKQSRGKIPFPCVNCFT